jgi:hypothetical protein
VEEGRRSDHDRDALHASGAQRRGELGTRRPRPENEGNDEGTEEETRAFDQAQKLLCGRDRVSFVSRLTSTSDLGHCKYVTKAYG